MSVEKGRVLVISGPSGVGKGTVVKKLLERNKNMHLSVSCTTRAIRPGEQDGVNYFYISEEKFNSMIDNNEFIEYARVFGLASYGTPFSEINLIEKGLDVILEIDVEGALNIKDRVPEALLIMITPPSFEALISRLKGRGTEDHETQVKRLSNAKKELSLADRYDYCVVNDDLDTAVKEIEDIVRIQRASAEAFETARKTVKEIKEYGEIR